MGIVTRQSIISSGLLYLGAAIGYVNILFLFPKYMSLDEIGITRTLQDMAVLLVPLAQFGLTQTLLRFFPKMGLKAENKGGFLTFMLLMGVLSFLIFLVFYFLLQDWIVVYFSTEAEVLIQYLPLMLSITFLLLTYNLLVAYTQSLLTIVAPNFIRYVFHRVMIALLILIYAFRYISFEEFLYGLVVSYSLMVLIIIGYLISQKEFSISFDFSFLNRKLLKQLLGYTLFSLLGASGMLIIGKIDSLMVTAMLGTDYNGIYTTAFYIAVVIEFPKRAINQISLPLVSRSFENNDMPAIKKLYSQSSINQLLVGAFFLILIWINLDSIFELMPKGDAFAAGKYVVLIIGLGRIFDMAAGINSEIIVMSRYFRFNMILLAVLAAITILLNQWLIPTYGINGAAIGSAAALTFFNISKFIFLKAAFGIQPFTRKTLPVILLSAVTLLIVLYLPGSNNPYLDILWKSFIATAIFGLGVLWIKPSAEVSELLQKVGIRKKRN